MHAHLHCSSSEQVLAQHGLDDPFKGKSAAARVARDGYLHMWDVLIREAAATELLFDSYLLEKVANLVIALNWCAFCCIVLFVPCDLQ